MKDFTELKKRFQANKQFIQQAEESSGNSAKNASKPHSKTTGSIPESQMNKNLQKVGLEINHREEILELKLEIIQLYNLYMKKDLKKTQLESKEIEKLYMDFKVNKENLEKKLKFKHEHTGQD